VLAAPCCVPLVDLSSAVTSRTSKRFKGETRTATPTCSEMGKGRHIHAAMGGGDDGGKALDGWRETASYIGKRFGILIVSITVGVVYATQRYEV
jgi:hypothetical protein